jgi:hypothetical protein
MAATDVAKAMSVKKARKERKRRQVKRSLEPQSFRGNILRGEMNR